MRNSLLNRWFGRHTRAVIPDALWQQTTRALPFLTARTPDELARLRALADAFLQSKEMSGAGGLELSAHMQVHIAAQACLPILNLGLNVYDGWTSIVVYPSTFVVPRSEVDESGVVHEFDDAITGEAWDRGPVLLSWSDAAQTSNNFNVVIHEFAHKLDLLNGDADGLPRFTRTTHPQLDAHHWIHTLNDAMNRLRAELELIEDALPAGVSPDDEAAEPYFAHLPLDPYAAQNAAEFFAVSSEAFFTDATGLSAAFPEWTRLLALYFKQAPHYP